MIPRHCICRRIRSERPIRSARGNLFRHAAWQFVGPRWRARFAHRRRDVWLRIAGWNSRRRFGGSPRCCRRNLGWFDRHRHHRDRCPENDNDDAALMFLVTSPRSAPYSGAWQTASMLWPSGSSTNAPYPDGRSSQSPLFVPVSVTGTYCFGSCASSRNCARPCRQYDPAAIRFVTDVDCARPWQSRRFVEEAHQHAVLKALDVDLERIDQRSLGGAVADVPQLRGPVQNARQFLDRVGLLHEIAAGRAVL